MNVEDYNVYVKVTLMPFSSRHCAFSPLL